MGRSSCAISFTVRTRVLSMASSMSFSTPPTQLTEKMTRPPVVMSNISRIFSRSRQLCMNRLSKPMASASSPSHSRWLWMRLISIQMVRR